jgi:hypothetical protein
MIYTQTTYDVVEINGTRHEDVLPTPRLISEGTAGNWLPRFPVEAYRQSVYNGKEIWRVRDDAYDPPQTEYVRVRVEVVER